MKSGAPAVVLFGLLFLGGCVNVNIDSDNTGETPGFICGNHQCEAGESFNSCPQDCSFINTLGNVCGNNVCEPGEAADECPQDCGANVAEGTPPLISRSRVNPTNPSLGETVEVEATASDDAGVNRIVWESTKPFSGGQSGSFECGGQASCTNTWELATAQEGGLTLTIYAVDSSGRESPKSTFEINVGPGRGSTIRCGNSVCEEGESSETCSADCGLPNRCGNGVCDDGESTAICPADCGEEPEEDGCTFNSDCGYKQVCTAGTCRDVECTNDGQCGSSEECESNRCVSCPSGPFGPAC